MPTAWRPLVWAASSSVCVAGWLIAHSLAYRLIASGDESSGALIERTGHGHLAFSPYLTALSAAVLLLALAGAVVAGAMRRPRPAVPLVPYILLPLADFAGHTMLESARDGHVVSTLDSVFLVGLALQVPLALVALQLARLALAWAEGVGRGLTPRWCPCPLALTVAAPPRLLIGVDHRPSIPALASGRAQRGPPGWAVLR